MSDTSFRGIYTVIYRVPDLDAAKAWYARAFGSEPYFDEPYYVGFDIAGYELGLQPGEAAGAEAGGVVAYWGVESAERAVRDLVAAGAAVHSDAREVGGGIRVATVRDPFGNLIGVIENPHFGAAHS
jgi:predicted enzyme related to lactoylglutathione lyase